MSAFVSVFVYDELMKSHCSWQPRPTWVVGFGALDQVLSEGTLWSRHWRYVRLQLEPGSFTKPSERLRSFKNDAHLDLGDVAIAFEGTAPCSRRCLVGLDVWGLGAVRSMTLQAI